jgi:hypothetical protein
MALSAYVGSFLTGTGTGTIPITGVGFQPKVIIFWFLTETGVSVDTVVNETNLSCIGFAVSATDRRCVFTRDIGGASTSQTAPHHNDTACVISCNGSGAVNGALDLQSMDADGFTLAIDDAFPITARVHFLALGGEDLTNVQTGSWSEPGATGNHDITSLAFQPDCLLVMACAHTGSINTGSSALDSGLCLGAATSSSQQGSCTGSADDASATADTDRHASSSQCLAMIVDGGGDVDWREEFVEFLSNGFRLNCTARASTRTGHFLALKGGSFRVGSLLTQTDTTTAITASGLGFAPTGVLFGSAGGAESSGTTTSAHDHLSIGAASSPSVRGAQGRCSKDGPTVMEVIAAVEFDAVYVRLDTTLATTAVAGVMDLQSLDSGGFTCIMDDADPDQAFVWYLAVGSSAAAPATPAFRASLLGVGR